MPKIVHVHKIFSEEVFDWIYAKEISLVRELHEKDKTIKSLEMTPNLIYMKGNSKYLRVYVELHFIKKHPKIKVKNFDITPFGGMSMQLKGEENE